MLNLEKLYNYLENEYNEDLDYIDEIYLYLHVKKLIEENIPEKTIIKEMELLDNGKFLQLKYENIEINTLLNMLKKYNTEKKNLELNINSKLKNYDKNVEDLIQIHNDIANIKLENNECLINILNHKLELWWNWITDSIINLILENNTDTEKTKEEKKQIIIVKQIFKYLNIINKINNINIYTYKLIIYDIKHFGKKNLNNYSIDLLKNCCIYINDKLQKCYPNKFINIDNINDINELINYLIINENLYEIDDEKNIIIYKIEDQLDLFYKLNTSYNLYKTIKIHLKKQFDKNQNIDLTDDLSNMFSSLYEIIYKLDIDINNEYIHNQIYKELELDESVKNKYYLFVNYINNILLLIFDYYFDSIIKKKTMIYECLSKKYNYLKENKKLYINKL
tara:strand:- start:80 stop:1261 length:1182 start_codon:yes stop_codon:yes gene_type:complete